MVDIITANTDTHFNDAKSLFVEYANWLKIDLCFQNFEAELKDIKTMYASPMGIILLAYHNNNLVGCVAVRQKENLVAELKRMYVKSNERNLGIGTALLTNSLTFATSAGYKKIRLDTLASMTSAIKLYTQNGFVETTAYYFNPESDALFFEKEL